MTIREVEQSKQAGGEADEYLVEYLQSIESLLFKDRLTA